MQSIQSAGGLAFGLILHTDDRHRHTHVFPDCMHQDLLAIIDYSNAYN